MPYKDLETRRAKQREAQQRYIQKHPDKIKKLKKAYYERHPEKIKERDDRKNHKRIDTLDDQYVRILLSAKTGLKPCEFSQDLVELKRTTLLIKRSLRKVKGEKDGI